MQRLKSNSSGFLVGDAVEISDLVGTWGSMQADLRAIRKALENGVPLGAATGGKAANKSAHVQAQMPPQNRRNPDRAGVALPVGPAASKAGAKNSLNAKIAEAKKAEKPNVNNTLSAKLARTGNGVSTSQAASNLRDSKGRFSKGEGAGGGDIGGGFSGSGGASFKGTLDKLSRTLDGMGNAEQVDPAVKAFNEVAKPMTRGLQGLGILGDGESREERGRNRWYRRFWGFFKKQQQDTEKHQKEVKKSLKVLEDKPIGKGGGSGGLFSKFAPALSGGIGAIAGALGAAIGAGLRGLLKIPGFKKLPLIGGVLASLSGLFDIFSSESSNMSRADKDKATGKAAGGIGGVLAGLWAGGKAGALAGGALGSLFSPAGTAVGSAIGAVVGGVAGAFLGEKAGAIIGEQVGTYARSAFAAISASAGYLWDEATAVFRGIGGAASEAFDSFKSWAGDAFDSFKSMAGDALGALKKWADSLIDTIGGWGGAFNEWIKQKTGVDVGEKIGNAYEGAKTWAGGVYDSVAAGAKELGGKAYDLAYKSATESTMGRAAQKGIDAWKKSRAASTAQTALVNQMNAAGITDESERAAFMAQMHHESGGFKQLSESFNYSSADRVMEVSATAKNKGRAAVEAAMAQGPQALAELMYGGRKDLGNTQAGDGWAFRGRGFTQLTGRANYERAGKALGLDLVNNPELASDPEVAAKVAMWYWQSRNIGEAARAGDHVAVTKKINGGTNGLEHRLALTQAYQRDSSITSIPVASNRALSMPAAAPMPVPAVAPAPAPELPALIGSNEPSQRQTALIPLVDAGQDISERGIAHIATGGISS